MALCTSRLACSLRHCRPSLGQVSKPSPLCLSPEVLLHTDAQTEAIDVWSAGMTLMELLTGCTTLCVDDQTGLSSCGPCTCSGIPNPSVAQGLHCRDEPRLRLTDLGAKLTRAHVQLDAAVKQRADEKSVFGDVSESVDALQRAIVVVSARSDADGMASLQTSPKLKPPCSA